MSHLSPSPLCPPSPPKDEDENNEHALLPHAILTTCLFWSTTSSPYSLASFLDHQVKRGPMSYRSTIRPSQ